MDVLVLTKEPVLILELTYINAKCLAYSHGSIHSDIPTKVQAHKRTHTWGVDVRIVLFRFRFMEAEVSKDV